MIQANGEAITLPRNGASGASLLSLKVPSSPAANAARFQSRLR